MLLVLTLALFATVTGLSSASPLQAQSGGRPPVNVASALLFVECAELTAVTKEVRFAYVQLDGNAVVRSATVENGGLIQAGNVPAVQFKLLSFDGRQDALYRFILEDDSTVDVLMTPEYWLFDRRSGILYSGISC
jgi:hypothetical protein